MKWIPLTSEGQLNDIVRKSAERPQAIFKYSSRCSLSDMIKDRLERKTAPEGIDFYFLDLIAYRALSGRIATMFHVHHESPQVLLIRNGECVYDESHAGIRMDELVMQSM
jgi:bacillithiol system protein YtxJ